ncbi:MAG: DUF3592 domain-containing protein [Desulfuromonadales bacterium]|nr:DUF3592 domain-containing protein [Desulfuromonadales bacterium]
MKKILGIILIIVWLAVIVLVSLAYTGSFTSSFSDLVQNYTWLFTIIAIVSAIVGFRLTFNGMGGLSKKEKTYPLVMGKLISIDQGAVGYVRVNGQPSCRLTIQFTTNDGQQITATIRKIIQLTDLAQFQPGIPLPIRYNPQNPQHIAIDFNADLSQVQPQPGNSVNAQQTFMNPGQVQMNFDPMQLQAQMMNEGVTTQAAMDIRNTGVQAKGVILSAQPTGNIVANNGEIELKIEVTKPDGSQYQATVRKAIPPIALPYIQVGRVIQVFYKPENEQNITIGL